MTRFDSNRVSLLWKDPEYREKQIKAHTGHKNASWKGGITIHAGYIYRYTPNHPLSNNKGYVFEHRLVMEKHLGRYLSRKEVVHHKNGVKTDNRLENLELFVNNGEHTKRHYKTSKWSKKYNKCVECGTTSIHHEAHGLCKRCYKERWYKNEV